MLSLTRKVNEAIIINDDINIEILSIKDGKVKLGFKAPREIKILRKEVYEEIQLSNKLSVKSDNNINPLKELLGDI
ncbi:MAG: carbon storage regulator [Epulopiscium sp. Nuni2H_MBin003]|nr:MAG: carbon storage regulator [Epulopiscium sp. Nuni2H_MBin003]